MPHLCTLKKYLNLETVKKKICIFSFYTRTLFFLYYNRTIRIRLQLNWNPGSGFDQKLPELILDWPDQTFENNKDLAPTLVKNRFRIRFKHPDQAEMNRIRVRSSRKICIRLQPNWKAGYGSDGNAKMLRLTKTPGTKFGLTGSDPREQSRFGSRQLNPRFRIRIKQPDPDPHPGWEG